MALFVLLFAVNFALAYVLPAMLPAPLANDVWSKERLIAEPVSNVKVSTVFALILISVCEPSPV